MIFGKKKYPLNNQRIYSYYYNSCLTVIFPWQIDASSGGATISVPFGDFIDVCQCQIYAFFVMYRGGGNFAQENFSRQILSLGIITNFFRIVFFFI